MPSLRPTAMALLILFATFAAGCSNPAAPAATPTTTGPADLTDEVAAAAVREYIEGQWGRDVGLAGRHELFTVYFKVLGIEVLEMTTSGSVAHVRCDIAIEPLEPIPTEAPNVDIFHNVVGRGAKLGPFIVTRTFLLRLTELGWMAEDMLD